MWQKSNKKKNNTLDEPGLRGKCIELLARREYSFAELEKKLSPVCEDEELLYKILEWTVEQGYQSDERFSNMYVRSKAVSGYGPVRIRLELNQKGIAEYLIEQAFEVNMEEINWESEVDRLIDKKAKNLDMTDMKSKTKVMGYLQRRGFTLDVIYSGLDRYKEKLVF